MPKLYTFETLLPCEILMPSEMWSGNWKLLITFLVNCCNSNRYFDALAFKLLAPNSVLRAWPIRMYCHGSGGKLIDYRFLDMTSNRKFELVHIAWSKKMASCPMSKIWIWSFEWMEHWSRNSVEYCIMHVANLVPTSLTCCFTIVSSMNMGHRDNLLPTSQS